MKNISDLEWTPQDSPFNEEIFNELFGNSQPLTTEADNKAESKPPDAFVSFFTPPPNTAGKHDSVLPSNSDAGTDDPSASLPWKSAASFVKNNFSKMVEKYKTTMRYDIGFPQMGDHGILTPCMLILGAESSVGKTTFLTQVADQLSACGKKVLFFSLEQSEFDITSKGLSRTMALQARSINDKSDLTRIPSAGDLQLGKATVPPEIMTTYVERAKNVYIVHKLDNVKVGTIVKVIDKFCETCPEDDPPVVIIDYFQVLSTDTGGDKSKSSFDSILSTLRECQKNHQLLMIVISSVNRSHYGKPICFASFKETGNIEYDADKVWGLQFDIINSQQYQSGKDIKQAMMIRKARSENPRTLELSVLKGRLNGLNDFHFTYYPNCDLFLEVTKKASEEEEAECPSEMDNSCEEELGPE